MKLQTKYSLAILALLLALGVSFGAIEWWFGRTSLNSFTTTGSEAIENAMIAELQAKQKLLVQILSTALTNPLYQLDMAKISDIVASVKQHYDVTEVYVYDKEGNILHDGTKELSLYGNPLNRKTTRMALQQKQVAIERLPYTLVVDAPILISDDVLLGGISVTYSLKSIKSDIEKRKQNLYAKIEEIGRKELRVLFAVAIVFLLTGFCVSIVLGHAWSRPIEMLSSLSEKIGRGDYDITIPVNRLDEIGKLAGSFRDMVTNLKELRQRDFESSEALRAVNIKLTETNNELVNEVAERKRAEDEVLRHNTQMRVLNGINSAVNSTLNQQVLLDTFLAKVKQLLPYSATSVRLFNKATGSLEPIAEQNLGLEIKRQIPNTGLSHQVFEQKAPIIVEDLQTDPRTTAPDLFQRLGLVSYAGIPLIAEGEILGVVGFYTKTKCLFTKEETEFLLTLAGEVAMSLRRSQLYGQLKLQAERLEKANAAKDEFLSVMSHELRTPLNVIMGYAQVMSSGYMGDITPEQEKSLKKLLLHAGDLLTMINNILQAGRLQSGLVEVQIEALNINSFLAEMESAYEFCSKQGVALIWQSPSSSLTFETDRSKLKHIIQNLVNNAVKFTEEGSVTVTVRQINGAVEFRVQDTGIGIPSDSLTTIFEMFQQADSSKTRTYGGTGVGLFIVKKFTEALNGQVHVESIVGKGTTFILTLPMATNHDGQNLPILDSIPLDVSLDPSEPSSTLSV